MPPCLSCPCLAVPVPGRAGPPVWKTIGMIKAHAIEFDLDVGSPAEVVATVHSEHLKIPLQDYDFT